MADTPTVTVPRAVWKYQLGLADGPQELDMPVGAVLLHCAMQGEHPTLWAEVVPGRHTRTRRFVVHGTGHAIDHEGHWVGTALHVTAGFTLVWHVYELPA